MPSHYLYTEGQKRFLQRKAIEEKELDDCCNCVGDCDTKSCNGFTRACLCDKDWQGIRGVRQARQAIQSERRRIELAADGDETK